MGQKHALIVGLTYPNETHYLRGFVNDAIRVKDMLINYYDFAPDDVKLVVDANGTMNTPQLNEFRVKETKTMINDEYICRKLSKMIKKILQQETQYCSGFWNMEDVLKNYQHSIMTHALKSIWYVKGTTNICVQLTILFQLSVLCINCCKCVS
jgi:hypothetical protein